jgi:hypothetical protein
MARAQAILLAAVALSGAQLGLHFAERDNSDNQCFQAEGELLSARAVVHTTRNGRRNRVARLPGQVARAAERGPQQQPGLCTGPMRARVRNTRSTAQLKYPNQCERIRRDLSLVSLQLASWEWFVPMQVDGAEAAARCSGRAHARDQAKNYPRVKFPGTIYHPYRAGGFSLRQFLDANRHLQTFICGPFKVRGEPPCVRRANRRSRRTGGRYVPQRLLRGRSVRLGMRRSASVVRARRLNGYGAVRCPGAGRSQSDP